MSHARAAMPPDCVVAPASGVMSAGDSQRERAKRQSVAPPAELSSRSTSTRPKVNKRTAPFGDIRLSFNHLSRTSFTMNKTATKYD